VPIDIGVPEVRVQDAIAEYSVPYSIGNGQERSLRYQIPAEFAEMISPRADAALVALLIPAMKTGGELRVEGPVTDELVYRMHHGYQNMLSAVIPGLRPVRVVARREVSPGERGQGVATGFSAGVDSYALLADHFYDQSVPPSLRVTHLLFNNTGSHDDAGDAAHALFVDRYERASRVADKIGLPLIPVDSNLTEVYAMTGWNFQQTHTPRNASVAFLLQRGFGTWLYASSVSLEQLHVGPHFDTSSTDPIALPLLSTGSLQLESDGGQRSRFDKTLRIAEIPDTYWSLDVCVVGDLGGNCSRCFKCLRTLAALEIGGVIDRYAEVFDLKTWEREREQYLAFIRVSRDKLVKEMVPEAKKRGFDLPRATPRRLSPLFFEYVTNEATRYGMKLREALKS
jgi:hypothetical protein